MYTHYMYACIYTYIYIYIIPFPDYYPPLRQALAVTRVPRLPYMSPCVVSYNLTVSSS